MNGQKYKHPGIRRASWNPEVAENVAGRLIPKPRKGQFIKLLLSQYKSPVSCASLDLPLGVRRLTSCEKVSEDNSEPENPR